MTTSGLLAALILGSFFHLDMGPAMTKPVTDVPVSWSAPVSGDLITPRTAWWTLFREPVLDRCVEEAFRNNRNLEQALARVEQARAVLGETRSQQSPEVNLQVEAARARVIEGANGSSSPTNTNDVLGAVSYEADLWSKLRKATTAAKLQLLSSEAARDTVRLSLAGQVAKAYFSLRGQDQQLQIAQETLQTRKEALALRKLLYEKGRTSELDYRQDQSETAVAAVKVRQMENALLVLMGRNPQEQVANQVTRGVSLDALPQPPEIPPGLPSQLLSGVRTSGSRNRTTWQPWRRSGRPRRRSFPPCPSRGSSAAPPRSWRTSSPGPRPGSWRGSSSPPWWTEASASPG